MITNDGTIVGCAHQHYAADVEIINFPGSQNEPRLCAEVAIRCATCGVAFRFIGLPAGLILPYPMLSPDCATLRLEIAPGRLEPGAGRVVVPSPGQLARAATMKGGQG